MYLLDSLKGWRRALVATEVGESPRHVPQMSNLPGEGKTIIHHVQNVSSSLLTPVA